MSETRSASRPPIVLFGYLGGRNLGDDAMLAGFFEAARPAGRRYIVLARDPAAVQVPEGVIAEIRPASFRSAIDAILRADGIARIGGTSFHDEYGDEFARGMLAKYIKLAALFIVPKLLGKRVGAFGIGFGTMRRTGTRLLARLAMSACSWLVVRDPQSLGTAQNLSTRAELGVDLAFLLPPVKSKVTARSIGLSVLDLAPYGHAEGEQDAFWLRVAHRAIGAETGPREVMLFAFKDNENESDRPVAERLAAALVAEGHRVKLFGYGDGLEAVRGAIANCEVFVATRYHSAVLAGQAGCRLLIVPYNEKLRHYAQDMQLPGDAIIELDGEKGSIAAPELADASADFLGRSDRTRRAVLAFLEAT